MVKTECFDYTRKLFFIYVRIAWLYVGPSC